MQLELLALLRSAVLLFRPPYQLLEIKKLGKSSQGKPPVQGRETRKECDDCRGLVRLLHGS